jgi:hypothetical protein
VSSFAGADRRLERFDSRFAGIAEADATGPPELASDAADSPANKQTASLFASATAASAKKE